MHVNDLAKSRTQMFIKYLLIFISLVMVRVSVRVMVRFNNSHMSRKSRTASYLACDIFGMTAACSPPSLIGLEPVGLCVVSATSDLRLPS